MNGIGPLERDSQSYVGPRLRVLGHLRNTGSGIVRKLLLVQHLPWPNLNERPLFMNYPGRRESGPALSTDDQTKPAVRRIRYASWLPDELAGEER